MFNKLDNYFAVSANSQRFLGFEMTANFRDTFPLRLVPHAQTKRKQKKPLKGNMENMDQTTRNIFSRNPF